MAATIRQIGLKLLVTALRLLVRPAPRGWRSSSRANELSSR